MLALWGGVAVPQIDTPRLHLRAFEPRDFDLYAALWAEPAVVRFIGGTPLSREAAWLRFLRQIGHWHHRGFGFFAIEDRSTGGLIGEAGFHDLRRDLTPSIEGTLEAGWVLAGAAQERGFVEEAMRAALTWADRHHPIPRMTCIIRPDHQASLHVASKLGFIEFARADYNGSPMVLLERSRPLVSTA